MRHCGRVCFETLFLVADESTSDCRTTSCALLFKKGVVPNGNERAGIRRFVYGSLPIKSLIKIHAW